MTGADQLLRVRGLAVAVGESDAAPEAVTDVSLTVSRGEVLGIVGESGSGKTLTLRAIGSLLPNGVEARAGEALLEGEDVLAMSPEELRKVRGRRIGMVFQEPMTALNPTMRIGEQIAESARLHLGLSRSEAAERAVDLLGRVGISDARRCADLYPHQLSGGMRQRAMLTIAIAADPALLLCDEPTTALDSTVTLQVLELLTELKDRLDLGIVIVTHDLGVVARTCSRVVVMYAGRIVEEGAVDDVLARPRHPYTLALLRAVPTRESTVDDLQAIPGSPPALGERPPGCPFAPRCALAESACEQAGALIDIDAGRRTACRRHELLVAGERASHA